MSKSSLKSSSWCCFDVQEYTRKIGSHISKLMKNLLDPTWSLWTPRPTPTPILSSSGSAFCADSYFGVRSTPVLPQQHVKDYGHSAKSAGGRLQLNTHAPYVCGFARSDMVHGCMVYTERAAMAAVSCGTSHASAVSTPLRRISKNAL